MNELFDKLNLKPQERRFVVGVFVVVLIILNQLFVWPYFSEWSKVSKNIKASKDTIIAYQTEILRDTTKGGYQETLTNLDKSSPALMLREGDVQLQSTILDQAKIFNVAMSGYSSPKVTSTQTNQSFFEEQSASVNFIAEEKDLIDFLYAVGGDNSMIRVRELKLQPQDNLRYRLSGSVRLTATYQKKPATPAVTVTNKPTVSKPTLVSAPKKAPTNAAPAASSAPAASKKAPPTPPSPAPLKKN
jgi:hypothetical protein